MGLVPLRQFQRIFESDVRRHQLVFVFNQGCRHLMERFTQFTDLVSTVQRNQR